MLNLARPALFRPRLVDGSAQFVRASTQSMTRTFLSGDRTKWTFAAWVLRNSIGTTQRILSCNASSDDNGTFEIYWGNDDTFRCAAWTVNWMVTTATFSSTSGWYHLCVGVDTNEATANNRIRMYVNAVEITSFSTRNNPTAGQSLGINQAALHRLGASQVSGGSDYSDQLMADVHFIEGYQLSPWSFVANGVPRDYASQFGNNGFRLDFRNIGDLGADVSGKRNSWTNSGATRSMLNPA